MLRNHSCGRKQLKKKTYDKLHKHAYRNTYLCTSVRMSCSAKPRATNATQETNSHFFFDTTTIFLKQNDRTQTTNTCKKRTWKFMNLGVCFVQCRIEQPPIYIFVAVYFLLLQLYMRWTFASTKMTTQNYTHSTTCKISAGRGWPVHA